MINFYILEKFMGLSLADALNCKNDTEYYVFKKRDGVLFEWYIHTLKHHKEKSVNAFMEMFNDGEVTIDTISNEMVQIDLQQLAFLYKQKPSSSVYFLRDIESKSFERFKFDKPENYCFKFITQIYVFMSKDKYHATFGKK